MARPITPEEAEANRSARRGLQAEMVITLEEDTRELLTKLVAVLEQLVSVMAHNERPK